MKNFLYIPRRVNERSSGCENYWHCYDDRSEKVWTSDSDYRNSPEMRAFNAITTPQTLLYQSDGKGGGTFTYLDKTETFNDGKSGVILSVELPCKSATADRAAEYIGCDLPAFLKKISTAANVRDALSAPDPDTWFKTGKRFPETLCTLQGRFKATALYVLDALIARKRGNGKPVLLSAQNSVDALVVLKTALRALPAPLRARVSFLTNATAAKDLIDLNIDIACALPKYADNIGTDLMRKIEIDSESFEDVRFFSCYCHCLEMGLDPDDLSYAESFMTLERASCLLLLERGELFEILYELRVLRKISEEDSLEKLKAYGEEWYRVRDILKDKLGKDLKENKEAKTNFNGEFKRCFFEPGIRVICRSHKYAKENAIITAFKRSDDKLPSTMKEFIERIEELIKKEDLKKISYDSIASLPAEDIRETESPPRTAAKQQPPRSRGSSRTSRPTVPPKAESTEERRKFNKGELESGRQAHLGRLSRYMNRKDDKKEVEKLYYDATAGKAAVRSKWKFRLRQYLPDFIFLGLTLLLLLGFRPILQQIDGGAGKVGSWDLLVQTLGLMGRGWECLLLSWDISIVSIPVLPMGIILLASVFVAGGYGLHYGETTGFVLRRIFALAFVIALLWALLLIILMSVYVW